MKASILGGLLVATLVTLGPATSQDEAPPDELAELREIVAAQGAELEAQRAQMDEMALLMEQTVEYLTAQARASQDLDRAFASAESQGFTAGINYQSRETLLAGLRAYTASQRSALPGSPPAGEPSPLERGGRR